MDRSTARQQRCGCSNGRIERQLRYTQEKRSKSAEPRGSRRLSCALASRSFALPKTLHAAAGEPLNHLLLSKSTEKTSLSVGLLNHACREVPPPPDPSGLDRSPPGSPVAPFLTASDPVPPDVRLHIHTYTSYMYYIHSFTAGNES